MLSVAQSSYGCIKIIKTKHLVVVYLVYYNASYVTIFKLISLHFR